MPEGHICKVCGGMALVVRDGRGPCCWNGLDSGRVYRSQRWRRVRRQVLERDHYRCRCGGRATTVDHVVAISQGGAPFSARNLESKCGSCHGRKHGRLDY